MFNVLDLFCGAGGFSQGFSEMGAFRIILAIDNDPVVLRSYQFNHPNSPVLCEDIETLRSETLQAYLTAPPDVIIASPPCESFTNANPHREKMPLMRLYDDEHGRLVLHAIRLIGDLSPKVFILENVPQLVDGELKEALSNEFNRVGYDLVFF